MKTEQSNPYKRSNEILTANKTTQAVSASLSDSQSHTTQTHSTRFKVVLAITLVLGVSATGFAQLVVHDPKHMAQNIIEFTKNLSELKAHQKYRELMDGAWKDPLKLVKVANTTLAALGVDTKQLGWATDNYRGEKAVRVASLSIDEVQKIIKGDIKAGENLGQSIQEIYGEIPVTRRGAQVRMAYETVSGVVANAGDTNKAVKEMLENSEKIQKKLEDGNLVNGDRERLKGQQENLQLRAQILNLQQISYSNQLQAQTVAMKAGQEAREEQERLRARSGMLGAMGALAFSPAGKKIEGQE